MTDNEAMEMVKSGDKAAIGILYERYKMPLYSYAFHQLNDRFTAEDIVQNTFLKVLKYADNYKRGSNFKAWLYTIGRNLLRDHFRNEKAHRRHKRIEELHNESHDTSTDISAIMDQEEDRQFLWKLLGMLEPEKREILVLVKLHEMKYKEVAEILDMKEGYLRIIVFRTVRELQQLISTYRNNKAIR